MRKVLDKWWLSWAVAVGLVVGAYGWLWWESSRPEPPLSRPYRTQAVCLLTGAEGVAGEQNRPVWTAMQRASVETLVRAQFLEITGAQTVENGRSYLPTLSQGNCGLVVAADEIAIATVLDGAHSFPAQGFLIAGTGASQPNVIVVTSATVSDRIATEFVRLVPQEG
ncbi:hypothetical protein QEZ54_17285 [Catellatospora sp. KI3]|uniref:hypothetical protein n=1 Tax=Catellatospora sp. KI3 TaxID=3041620 RepID=UPI002482C7F5|nr:hypothetical protein [Catellatospora sp. KI3]MDI1462731.1 hypothetical protein [Catellatospora sp. KI3]